MAKTGLFNLERHFAFYGAYHSNPINIAIHTLFVWPIFLTALLILYFTPSLFNLPPIEVSLPGSNLVLILNLGFLGTLFYAVFYVCLDARAGSLAALLCFLCWVVSSYLANLMGFSLAWKVRILITFLICFVWFGFCFWLWNFVHNSLNLIWVLFIFNLIV